MGGTPCALRLHPACRDSWFHNVPPHHLQREARFRELLSGPTPDLRNKRRPKKDERQDAISMTKGSGCPPPLLVSHWILQHPRNLCQAGSELRLRPIAPHRERRASTPFGRQGTRRIQDPSSGDHPLVRIFHDGNRLQLAPRAKPGRWALGTFLTSGARGTLVRDSRHATVRRRSPRPTLIWKAGSARTYQESAHAFGLEEGTHMRLILRRARTRA